VREDARARSLQVIDATCPLVTKVHMEALHFSKRGHTLLLIGHADHDETIGTRGEAPRWTLVVETVQDAETVSVPDPSKVAVLTQTTLSVEDTRDIPRGPAPALPGAGPAGKGRHLLRHHQPAGRRAGAGGPRRPGAGDRRPNSSNSLRMAEVGEAFGPANPADRAGFGHPRGVAGGVKTVGVTASASAPEALVQESVGTLREVYGAADVEEFDTVSEDMEFPLPSELLQTA